MTTQDAGAIIQGSQDFPRHVRLSPEPYILRRGRQWGRQHSVYIPVPVPLPLRGVRVSAGGEKVGHSTVQYYVNNIFLIWMPPDGVLLFEFQINVDRLYC